MEAISGVFCSLFYISLRALCHLCPVLLTHCSLMSSSNKTHIKAACFKVSSLHPAGVLKVSEIQQHLSGWASSSQPYTREGIAEHDSFRKANNTAKCVKAVGGCDSFPRLTQTAALLLSHRECTHGTYGFIFDCVHIFHWFVTSHLSKKKRLSQFSTCNGFSSNPEILIKKVL